MENFIFCTVLGAPLKAPFQLSLPVFQILRYRNFTIGKEWDFTWATYILIWTNKASVDQKQTKNKH